MIFTSLFLICKVIFASGKVIYSVNHAKNFRFFLKSLNTVRAQLKIA